MTRHTTKVVLVVGASSGIGKSAAEHLASAGYSVFGTSRDRARVQSDGITGVDLEIGDDASVNSAVRSVVESAGRIDAIFYAAGFYTAGAIEETTAAQLHEQLDAYLVGAHRVTRAVLPHFRAARSGRLLFMSSSAGMSSLPYHVAYSVSKAALEAYCDGIRYEVEPFGVRVAYLHAGGVNTGAKASFQRAAEPIEAYDKPREHAIAAFLRLQENGPVPNAVGREVVRALNANRMRPVYRVDLFSKSLPLLKLILPPPVFRQQIRRSLGL